MVHLLTYTEDSLRERRRVVHYTNYLFIIYLSFIHYTSYLRLFCKDYFQNCL